MKPAHFIIPGTPRPWKRARTCNGRYFRHPDQVKHQGAIFNAWFDCGAPQFDVEPLSVKMLFVFKRPKSNKTAHPTYRNDLDNLAKDVLDALNEHMFADDGQVIDLTLQKRWGVDERTEVWVETA